MLSAKEISFRIDRKFLLQETSVDFEPGMFHVIMGANGAGKSTLLKLLAGDQRSSSGKIFLDGKDLDRYSRKQLAVKRAVLSQHYHISFPISVYEIVLMGRYPYFSNRPSALDKGICREAMELMDMAAMAERDYLTLSGGEAQKAQMSRVLAQIWEAGKEEGKILFLDEPVSHLDIKFQHQLLIAAKNLCAQGTTVVAILHDVNLALAFADRMLFMKEGRILYDKRNFTEVTTEIIKHVFDVSATIYYPERHKPVIILG
jgi:iron complex transport system ATP-binding protein